jgi:CBS-domain-containing membrane protein
MSPRAAWRLEAIGFTQVYDYEHGKRDWGSFGLPREGTMVERPSSADAARRDVPTCRLADDLNVVREHVRAAGWDTCIVVTEGNVVLGRLGRRALSADDSRSIEEAMSEGPSTVRPSLPLDKLVERIKTRNLTSFVVTTGDGKLVGLVLLDEAERLLRGDVYPLAD